MDRLPRPGAGAWARRFARAGETGAEAGEALEAAGAAVGNLALVFVTGERSSLEPAWKMGCMTSCHDNMICINDHDIYAKYYDIIWHIDDSLSA